MTAVGVWAAVADLVLPAGCAGCGAERVPLRYGACDACVGELMALRPGPARPTPAPAGLPLCGALGPYAGVLREALLAYKERGRHGLAVPLGALLADVVAYRLGGAPVRVLLVPVPDTARAARSRHGAHIRRLAGHAAGGLPRAGSPAAVARPLRARSRADSAELDRVERLAASADAFHMAPGRAPVLRRAAAGRAVVVVDDILTTGATLAAISGRLAGAGVTVRAGAVLAATQLRRGG
ncbi:ComF family protein [Micromonospora sp. CPCC 205371]|nr:ComF family protein [Micromonospora sp. CPCC 205371]